MKFLFDNNLSRKLCAPIREWGAESCHVQEIGLADASDSEIWEYAQTNGYTIISKDTDFVSRAILLGHPPKVILVNLGNCSTSDVEICLNANANLIASFETTDDSLLKLTLHSESAE